MHSIPLRRKDGKVSTVVNVVPVRLSAQDVFEPLSAVLVVSKAGGFVADPAIIRSLFDLTPSEAAIARRLASGETADEIARSTGRSVLTVRTQLKSVLAKTGTRRQSELVQLLTRLVPPAR
jgi:DNA-binding CsgD family transcriptional regulator